MINTFLIAQAISWAGWLIRNYVFQFPTDWTNSEQVRRFVLNHASTMQKLVQATGFTLDDKLVALLLMLANNLTLWNMFFKAVMANPEPEPPIEKQRLLQRLFGNRASEVSAILRVDDDVDIARLAEALRTFRTIGGGA